jgi:hypothetical protein
MTSPACLNTSPDFPGNLSAYADVALASSTCPDGTSGSLADCTLAPPTPSISNNPQAYTDFSQTNSYNVQFDASSATAGTYTFHVHANSSDNNLTGYGWGYGGGVDLSVTVTNPQPTCNPDDSLNVTFSQPASASVTFCNSGTSIPVIISANDTSNKITSLTASVNNADITGSLAISGIGGQSVGATGSYAAGPVGAYTFDANAATQCTQGQASVTVDSIYNISGLQGPLAAGQKPKKGHTVPIQFNPMDCKGSPVPYDSTVEVVVSGPLTLDTTPTSCTGTGCGTGSSSDVTWNATTGYSSNLMTSSTVGTYSVNIYFGGVLNYHATFTTQ